MTRQNALLLALALVVSVAPGCSSGIGVASPYSAGPADMVASGWRNHVWANRAFETRIGANPVDRLHAGDYRTGFVAGYKSVCQGGEGKVPAVPPRQYWGSRYLSPEGQAKSQAWFEGFPEGVKAAQADGIDAYRDVYVTNLLDDLNQAQNEHRNPGAFPVDGYMAPGMDQLNQPVPILSGGETFDAPPQPMADPQARSGLRNSVPLFSGATFPSFSPAGTQSRGGTGTQSGVPVISTSSGRGQ